jgi:hypothetical protein
MKILSRDEMKNVVGGGTCAALINGVYVGGLTYQEASTSGSHPGDKWCCDSCSSASWVPPAQP